MLVFRGVNGVLNLQFLIPSQGVTCCWRRRPPRRSPRCPGGKRESPRGFEIHIPYTALKLTSWKT